MKEQTGHTMEKQSELRFGNYDLVRRIDVGGMGEVYLAKQRSAFDREVAVKIIREDLVHDLTARQRFLREAEVSSHLKHEHILPLYEFGEEQGRLFLVTPYIEGGTLARRLQNGPLPLSEVRQLFSALVNAVAYIHRRGVVHRDLKPSNILLDQGNEGHVYVRLIDFGIAKLQGTSASPPLTTGGNEMGTIAYMAPERLSGVAAPSNDIYSLGVILYQMLTGHLPIDEQGRPQWVPLPQPLDDVVHRCMASRIDERFGSAEEVLTAFERACQQMGMATRLLPAENAIPATASLQRSANVTPAFTPEDYSAPTTAVNASQIAGKSPTAPVAVGRSPGHSRGPGKGPLALLIMMLAILLLLAGSAVLAFQLLAIPTASIHFNPQVHLVSQVFQMTASTSVTSIDVASRSIPAKGFSESKTGSRTGPTTQSCDPFFGFGCQQVVSTSDADRLGSQIQQSLEPQITHDLQRQLQALGATEVGSVQFSFASNSTVNPPIGSPSKTVTVTLTEQGHVYYFLNKDAHTLARQLLLQQMQTFGANYQPVDSTIRIGQPQVSYGDQQVFIQIAAAGDTEYHFPQSQLLSIQNHIKGMTVNSARGFIAGQTGVEPSSIAITFFSVGREKIPAAGDRLPADVQHIQIMPNNLATLPSAPLPGVTPGGTLPGSGYSWPYNQATPGSRYISPFLPQQGDQNNQ